MRLKKSDLGSDIIVWFWDHGLNVDDLIMCKVRGEVIEVTKDMVKLRWWDLETRDDELRAENQETCVIGQALITQVLIMRPSKFRRFY